MTRLTDRLAFVLILLIGYLGAAPPTRESTADAFQAGTKDDDREQQREESIKTMRQRAQETKVRILDENESQTAVVTSEPLLYFTNEPHRIVAGSLWGWSAGGRPTAICKIEQYDRGRPDQEWLYCLASLSEHKVDVQWRDSEAWSAKTPGVVMRDFPDTPLTAKDERSRLRQMKELSRRFSAMDFEPNGPGTSQFRLLTQPLWRYSKTDDGIVDGAVFATEGAGAIYLIELQRPQGGLPRWRYGVTAMSAWRVSIKLDNKEIWTKPFTPGPAPYDNWVFRWERPVASAK